jgi:hypothetical protein
MTYVNNDHFLGAPRVVVVDRFDCACQILYIIFQVRRLQSLPFPYHLLWENIIETRDEDWIRQYKNTVRWKKGQIAIRINHPNRTKFGSCWACFLFKVILLSDCTKVLKCIIQ